MSDKYFLTKLDDGRQWLTDGHDFGADPDAVPDLVAVLKEIDSTGYITCNCNNKPQKLSDHEGCTWSKIQNVLAKSGRGEGADPFALCDAVEHAAAELPPITRHTTESTSHSPGPWTADPEGAVAVTIEDGNGKPICDVYGASNDLLCYANARAITAVPDVLAALHVIKNQSIGDDWTPEQAIEFIKQHASAAIAKAEAATATQQPLGPTITILSRDRGAIGTDTLPGDIGTVRAPKGWPPEYEASKAKMRELWNEWLMAYAEPDIDGEFVDWLCDKHGFTEVGGRLTHIVEW